MFMASSFHGTACIKPELTSTVQFQDKARHAIMTATKSPYAWVAALAAATFIVAAIFLSFGILCYPGMHADGDMFLPATMNVGAGRGWIVEGYVPLLMGRQGSELYNNHGFLMPFLFGALLHASSMQRIYLLCGITNALAAGLYAWLAATNAGRLSGGRALFAWLLAITAGVIGLALQGRPEQLALLIIPLPLIVSRLCESRVLFHGISIITIAALSALSPLLGLYYWVGHSVALLRINSSGLRSYLRLQLLTILAAVATFSLAIAIFTPFNTLILIDQILNYSKSAYIQGYQIVSVGNLHLQAPLWQLPLLAILAGGAFGLWRRGQMLLMLILAAPLLLLARLSGSYLYLPFLTLSILLLDVYSTRLPANIKATTAALLLSFLSLYLFIFARYGALEILYLSSPNRYEAVKANIEALQRNADREQRAVGYSKARFPSFVVFGDPGRELIAVRANADDYAREFYERSRKRLIGSIVFSQEGQMAPEPPAFIDGNRFALVDNHWSSDKATFLGIKLGGYVPGYSYAVYRRTGS